MNGIALRHIRDHSGCGRSAFHVALLAVTLLAPPGVGAATYYVRQQAGDDANDGTSPATGWRHVSKLSGAMHAGDVAYVGPGLYREQIEVLRSGTADQPITYVADDTGRHTGDPPGIVMLAGSEPVDESMFVPGDAPGVYTAVFPAWTVWGVVEMDGPQGRYVRTSILREHLVDGLSPVEVVRRLRSSWFYDEATRTLYLHTSNGATESSARGGPRAGSHGAVVVSAPARAEALHGARSVRRASRCRSSESFWGGARTPRSRVSWRTSSSARSRRFARLVPSTAAFPHGRPQAQGTRGPVDRPRGWPPAWRGIDRSRPG